MLWERMPSPEQIVAGLALIAQRSMILAIAWHAALVVALAALALGWRPSLRTARRLLVVPLLSVSALAFAFANPFNGVMFAVGAAALGVLGSRGPGGASRRAGAASSLLGVGAIAFGWVYPHFLDAHWTVYLYAAPAGLVPCPTLTIVIGFALLGGGLGSRGWSLTLAGLGLFYGLFGVLRLGVLLDLGLLVATAALVITALRMPTAPRATRSEARPEAPRGHVEAKG